MTYLKSIFSIMLLWAQMSSHALAQTTTTEKVTHALRTVSEQYLKTPFLSFDISYRYADPAQPHQYLDSVKGMLRMNSGNVWCSLDSTETISNTDYMITLFKEDQIMYLTRNTSLTQSFNPLAMLDSLLRSDGGLTGNVTDNNAHQRITLLFPPGHSYKEIQYLVNKRTRFIDQITAYVKAEQLYEVAARPLMDSHDRYALVETRFEHYQTNAFDTTVFKADRYFSKIGADFQPAATYSQYKIFLGTPDL